MNPTVQFCNLDVCGKKDYLDVCGTDACLVLLSMKDELVAGADKGGVLLNMLFKLQLKFAPELRLLEFAVRDTDEELDEEALLIFEA